LSVHSGKVTRRAVAAPIARITGLAVETPPLVDTAEIGRRFAGDEGGDVLAKTIESAAIESRPMAVNPLTEDPRAWPVGRRMTRALTEARVWGCKAGARVLSEHGLRPGDIGLFATCGTTTHSLPGLEVIAFDLGMPHDTKLLNMGPMGCYAAAPALSTAADWVAVHQRPALLLCVDMFSPHLTPPPYTKERAVVFSLFSDAAAAVLVEPAGTSKPGMNLIDTEMATVPVNSEDLKIHVTEEGVVVRLTAAMPGVVARESGQPTSRLLARHALTFDDIKWWAVHPGGRRIIEGVSQILPLPEMSRVVVTEVLRTHGNTISCGVLTTMERLSKLAPLRPGEHAVMLACGPGATIWAALLRG
jgi:alkylresorcinol/alkylpyrone synthase